MTKRDNKPTTRIGTPTSDAARLKMRGKDTLSEVVGEMSFAEAFYFIVTGKEPDETQARVFDAALVILMDHGLTPTAVVSRLVHDSVPDDIQVGMAAGLLMVGNKYAGTIQGAGALLAEGMDYDGDPRDWAKEVIRDFREKKKRIPGFGHPYYKDADPRAERLFEIARNAGVKGDYIERIKILEEEIEKSAGKKIVLNVTGALGAVLSEIHFPPKAMRAVSAVGRAAGLTAHMLEEDDRPITPGVVEFVNAIDYEDPPGED